MNLDIFFGAPWVVIIHTLCALAAFVLGVLMFVRKKGTTSHKMIGRLFALLMASVALTAIFIRQINNGAFSFIHIFVVVTFFALFETFYYIRKGNIRRHKRAVQGMFFGALLIPGIFSFMPGRLMWSVYFG